MADWECGLCDKEEKMTKRLTYILFVSAIITLLFIIIFNNFTRYSTNYETIKIELKTIVCGDCKTAIEKALKQDKGVLNVDVSLKSKSASVRFDKTKTDVHGLESRIVAAGYDANDSIADSTAYRNLNN